MLLIHRAGASSSARSRENSGERLHRSESIKSESHEKGIHLGIQFFQHLELLYKKCGDPILSEFSFWNCRKMCGILGLAPWSMGSP